MEQVKALLLHTLPEIRAELRNLLKEVDFVRVLGEACTAREAMELLDYIPYGILFLDTDLKDEVNGIELGQILSNRKNAPALVYIAKDESLAFKAFELEAVDYLLCPLEHGRFQNTIARLRQMKSRLRDTVQPSGSRHKHFEDKEDEEKVVQLSLGEKEEDDFVNALRQAWDVSQKDKLLEIEKLPIHFQGRMLLIPYNQIIFVEAYEDYSYVHTANEKYITSYRLKTLEDRLKPHRFFRVHRKFLVNLEMVTEIASMPGSNFMLRTVGKTKIELPVGRRRIAELKQILGF